MRKLPMSRSLLYFLEKLEYTEAALAADSDAESFAQAFRDAIVEWEDLFKREREARRDVIRAEAQVAVRNQQIDRLTIRFGAAIRALAPAFMDKVFKVAPNVFVRANLRKQCETTQNVLAAEVAKLETDHPLKPFGVQLAALATTAVEALDGRAARKGAAQLVANEVVEWKEGINTLRVTTYAELLKIAAAKGYSKTWVEAFFPADAEAEDDADADGSSAAPAASPA